MKSEKSTEPVRKIYCYQNISVILEHFGFPPNQVEEVNKTFSKQLQKVSISQTLSTGENFNSPNICYKGNMARCNHLRIVLENVKGNFLIKILDWPTKDEAHLDLSVNNREDVF